MTNSPNLPNFRDSLLKLPERSVTSPQSIPAILLFGMPGVGKGTQGALLGAMDGMFHCSTGEIFRGLDPNSEDGKKVASFMNQGNLVPDDTAVMIWEHWIENQVACGNLKPSGDILVLDGIPRSTLQCELLQERIDVLAVLYLAVEDDTPIVNRLRNRAITEGRDDDADENIIRHRFGEYRSTTEPVLGFYPQEIVCTIDPMGTQMEVNKRILERINPAIRRHRAAG